MSGEAINISKTTAPHAVSYPFTSIYNISHGHAVSLTINKFLKFNYKNNAEIVTFFTQEMLKRGYLAGSQVATSSAYNKNIINKYLKEVDQVFGKIRFFLEKGKFPLKGEIKHSTFKRLTG